MKISPLAPAHSPTLPPIEGVRLAAVEAGIKYENRKDLALIRFDEPAPVAGVLTRNLCPGAPVQWCRAVLDKSEPHIRAIIVNSGNANVFTGAKGEETVRETAQAAAQALGCAEDEIMVASTGVIGEFLDAAKMTGFFGQMAAQAEPDGWAQTAQAMMTTDTFPKCATQTADLGDGRVILNGLAKGSGMIAPDMATMLAFIVTDCPISQPLLQDALGELAQDTFNAVTVDGDTSTSDSVLAAATGRAACAALTSKEDDRWPIFRAALENLMEDLAIQIARDGEGAKKLMSIEVTGAGDKDSARKIAFSIANSPLVKTAIAGEDANWGRIVMAIGKAGAPVDRDRLQIFFGEVRLAHKGAVDPDYREENIKEIMARDEITIRADLGLGQAKARVWTCDLTHDYVSINGDYRS